MPTVRPGEEKFLESVLPQIFPMMADYWKIRIYAMAGLRCQEEERG